MNLLMVTNTFTPFVGGVARSVASFTEEFRRRGHRVIVVAPTFGGAPKHEPDVIRIPAIQRFNGSDFSVGLPVPGFLFAALSGSELDVVHSHHPYLLGDTALRIAAAWGLPLVFTHHTMYEMLTHYVPGDSTRMQRFVVELSTGYANLCDRVVAPSASTARILQARGVETPIEVIPTGIDLARFRGGDGAGFRASLAIPLEAFVVGHVGRLAPEKNLEFLVESVAAFLADNASARFLIAGSGPSLRMIRERFGRRRMAARLHVVGALQPKALADAYAAMDVFAFASGSETQGLVLAEAMAAGVPVVAVDAPGVREMVVDGRNGYLLPGMSESMFSEALGRAASLAPAAFQAMRDRARATAKTASIRRSADRALMVYESLRTSGLRSKESSGTLWARARRMLGRERELWENRAHAAGAAMSVPGRDAGDAGRV